MLKKILLSLLVVFTVIASSLSGCEPKAESNEIVFVCTHGAARSPIATAYFNKLAKENDLNYHAIFKGTEPDKELTKETVTGLTADGFEITDWKPERVSASDVEKAFKVVTFDCSVPSAKTSNSREEWNGTPSISKDYDKARNAIKKYVEQMIEELREE